MTNVSLDVRADVKSANVEGATLEVLQKILLETMLALEGHAKRLAPVDTGRLRASIHTFPTKPSNVITVSDGVSYGAFQEYGTSKMKAQPFIRPARDIALAEDFPRIVKKYDKK